MFEILKSNVNFKMQSETFYPGTFQRVKKAFSETFEKHLDPFLNDVTTTSSLNSSRQTPCLALRIDHFNYLQSRSRDGGYICIGVLFWVECANNHVMPTYNQLPCCL